jgi:hypothetical protein
MKFDISDYTKPHEYWYALVGALIALAIAYWEARRVKAKAKNEVRKGLLHALAYNRQLIQQVHGQLSKRESVPNYPLDADGLSDWNSRARGLISEEAFQRIHGLVFQLRHFSQVLSRITPEVLISTAQSDAAIHALLLQDKNVEVWILEAQVEVERTLPQENR